MKSRKWILLASVGLTLVAALVWGTAALAFGPGGQRGFGLGMMERGFAGLPGFGQRGSGPGPLQHLRRIVTDMLGLTPEELRAELEAGKTVAQIAEEQGVALEDLVQAIIEPVTERLVQKVTDGDLTQDEADTILAMIENRITEWLNQPFSPREYGWRGRLIQHGRQVFGAVADELGLTPEEFRAELRVGKTVAEIAGEQGVSLADLAEAITAPMAERLAERVATGNLTPDEADILLQAARIRVTKFLEGGWLHTGRAPQAGFESPIF